VVLWVCILGAVAGLLIKIIGSDIGALMVFFFGAIGTFPAFHFASLVAFKDAGADNNHSDHSTADRSPPPSADSE